MNQTSPSDDVLVREVLQAAARQVGTDASEQLRASLSRLKEGEFSACRQAIAAALPDVPSSGGAGVLAIWLGAGVEEGIDAQPTAEFVLQTLLRWCRVVDSGKGAAAESPAYSGLEDGLQLLGMSTVAHLVRNPARRQQLAEEQPDLSLLERAARVSVGAAWVLQLVQQRSGELMVLHAEAVQGFRVRYENIANCFHLFTLLQGTLGDSMAGGRVPSPEVIDVAEGRVLAGVSDEAWWHYGQCTVPQADLGGMVFGECSPDVIACCDGMQVLLLWTPILRHRSWDAGFFGPIIHAAPPRVSVIERLNQPAVAEWLNRLGIRDEPPRTGWRSLLGGL